MTTQASRVYNQTQDLLNDVARKALTLDYTVRITVTVDRFTRKDQSIADIHVSNFDSSMTLSDAVADWVYTNYSRVPANALTFSFVRLY